MKNIVMWLAGIFHASRGGATHCSGVSSERRTVHGKYLRRSGETPLQRYQILALGVALVLSGCTRTEDEWPDYTPRSGDLTGFIVESTTKLGARPRSTNGLPQVNADWHFKSTDDRVQIVLTGNHFLELQSILTNAFGPLPQPPQTTQRSMGASLGPDVGADINFTWDKTSPEDKEYTTLVIARAQKPKKAP